MIQQQKTVEVALYWAKTGTEILFSEDKVLSKTLAKEKLEENLYNQILQNLIDHDTFEMSEEQFQNCVTASKLN
jgi:hypothetical protein